LLKTFTKAEILLMNCFDCPVKCGADRANGVGVCKAPWDLVVSHIDLHLWEEPCISGVRGTVAVFFGGCNLNCVFCQNNVISHGGKGKILSFAELKKAIDGFKEKASTVSFVTPSHYVRQLSEFLKIYKKDIALPIVYNSGGYDDAESLKMLEGLVDVYLPDFKYADGGLAQKYGARQNYPQVALCALKEMLRQQPVTEFDENGIIKKGVLVRHLVLPDCLDNTKKVMDILAKADKNIFVSMMAQYFPAVKDLPYENLRRTLTEDEYDQAIEMFFDAGLTNGFSQELTSAEGSFVPKFNLID